MDTYGQVYIGVTTHSLWICEMQNIKCRCLQTSIMVVLPLNTYGHVYLGNKLPSYTYGHLRLPEDMCQIGATTKHLRT